MPSGRPRSGGWEHGGWRRSRVGRLRFLSAALAGGSTAAVTSVSALTRPPARLESSAVDLLGQDNGAGPVWPDPHDVRVGAEGAARIDDPLAIGRPGAEEIVEVVVGNPHRSRAVWIRRPEIGATAITKATIVREEILDPSGDQSPTPARSCAGVLTSSTCDPSRFMV